jgi:small conductance mechanosensitive channel
MESNVSETITQIIGIISAWGFNVLGALAILVGGVIAAGWAARMTSGALARLRRVDETLRHFLASAVRYALIIFTIVAVLERFGVETTSFIAVLGAAGLAIGLAFQGTLSHIAAGIMLLLFRPFKVGQFIDVAGVAGTVESISLFTTELNTPDNVHIVVPNGQLWGTAVKNYSHNATRRTDITIGTGYGDDIGKAFEIIRQLLAADERVNKEPVPALMVSNLGDSAVEVQLRVWCAASDYWPIKFDLTRRIKEGFDAGGISIPFPQRTIHMAKKP